MPRHGVVISPVQGNLMHGRMHHLRGWAVRLARSSDRNEWGV